MARLINYKLCYARFQKLYNKFVMEIYANLI